MIRKAHEEDLPRIAEIHSAAWHATYRGLVQPHILDSVTPAKRLTSWREWYALQRQSLYVTSETDEILGFVRISPARPIANPPDNYGEITHLYLDPTSIAKGLGHRLFNHARQQLESSAYDGMLLWTLEGNTRARNFYQRHGMKFDGTRHDEPAWLGEGVFEVRYVLPFDESS